MSRRDFTVPLRDEYGRAEFVLHGEEDKDQWNLLKSYTYMSFVTQSFIDDVRSTLRISNKT